MKAARPWVWGAAGAALLLLLLAGRSTAASAPGRLLVVGDSLAVGLGPWLKAMALQSGFEYAAVDARVGTRADQWDAKVPGLLALHRPTLVLVSLGTNDAAMDDPTVNRQRFQNVVDAVRATGARPVWVGMPSLPQRLKADLVRQMIQATGVDYFDSRTVSFERTADGIHATPAGYSVWAKAIWDAVLK